MTREQAQAFMVVKDKKYVDADTVRVCLNIIYDDFESRTCENCGWIAILNNGRGICDKYDSPCHMKTVIRKHTKCDKWESI